MVASEITVSARMNHHVPRRVVVRNATCSCRNCFSPRARRIADPAFRQIRRIADKISRTGASAERLKSIHSGLAVRQKP